MIRIAKFALALSVTTPALAGCDAANSEGAAALAMRESDRAVEIERLKGDIESLRQQQDRQKAYIDSVYAYAQAVARDQESVRGTINSNVDTDNKRHKATNNIMREIDTRLARYDGYRSYPDLAGE